MKISLLTIWKERNYGAEMQTYATVRVLKELGHTPEVIDFRLSDKHKLTLRSKIIRLLQNFTPLAISFRKFWRHYIPSSRYYKTSAQLKKSPPIADTYIVGSDQVWNPDLTQSRALQYFGDFIPKNSKVISYASSIGEASWHWHHLTSDVTHLLSKFSAISCREEIGRQIIHDTFGINATHVLDPTLLLPNYDEITGKISNNNAVVYYPLTDNPLLEQFAKELANTLGLGYINTNKKKYFLRKIIWWRTPIQDWIRNIAGASVVVTHSFHGLAFSLLYKRNFIIIQGEWEKQRSSRITSLLDALNLRDRYFDSFDEAKKSQIWTRPIDWQAVHQRLEALRASSLHYLQQSLQ